MNLPIVALTIVGAVIWIPKLVDTNLRRRRLDVPGALSVTLALALVIFGLGEAQSTSWTSTPVLSTLALAPVLLVIFAVVERSAREPLVPITLLRRRAAVANVLAVFQQSIGASTTFLAPLFLQQVWGFSPLHAGAGALPLPIGFVIGARLSSRLVHRFGAKPLVTVGFVLVAVGLIWLAQLPSNADYFATFFPALLVRSLGQGLVVVPIVVTVTSGVRHEEQGIAAGFFNMSQQLGGTLGLAVIATVVSAASRQGPIHDAARAHGFRLGFFICAVFSVTGALTAVIWLQSPRPTSHGERIEPWPREDVIAVELGSPTSP
jgi:MFS family permease